MGTLLQGQGAQLHTWQQPSERPGAPPNLQEVLPHAEYYKRGGFPLKKIISWAANREYTDVMVFNEDNKTINGMLLVHLPDGPTARFRLSSLTLGKDIKVGR